MMELIQQGKIAELIITFLLDLFIAIIAYLLVPTIFCIAGYNANRSYSLKTIKKIVFINGACVWFIIQIIRFYIGETKLSISGVLLWSWVAYWMMKKFLLEKNAESENGNEIEFEIVNKNEKKRNFKILFIVAIISLALSLALNLYQFGINNQNNQKLKQALAQELEEKYKLEQELQQNRELEQELQQNRDKLEFFDEYVVFVEDDNTNLYHKYECHRFKAEEFWAYNIDKADNLGYEPCPYCCG